MKKLLLLLALFGLSIALPHQAQAKGIIFYSNGEELKVLHQLPAEAEIEGQHVNLGIHYESFDIFWMPVWNYGDYKWALVNDAEDTYTELTHEEAQALATEYGIGEIPERPDLPLMSKIGLKPVLLLLIAFMIYGWLSPDKKEEEEAAPSDQPQA